MRFAYHATMCNPDFYLPLAIAEEEAGFDTFTLPDSICYPEESDSQYPYNGTGDREFLDGVPFLEPFSIIPAMGAVTTRLRFTTSIDSMKICPAPSRAVPILIGGHPDAALHRAARVADGFIHAGGTSEALETTAKQIDQYRAEYEREHEPFEYQSMGAEDSRSLEDKIGALRWFPDDFIGKTR